MVLLGYERVAINGRSYMVCAECRHPLLTGHSPCHPVPEPDMPNPNHKQALCGPCYKIQWARIYPREPVPDVTDGYLVGGEPVPHGERQIQVDYEDEYALWEAAIGASRSSGGAETVGEAYQRLSGAHKPDVTVTGPGGDEFPEEV